VLKQGGIDSLLISRLSIRRDNPLKNYSDLAKVQRRELVHGQYRRGLRAVTIFFSSDLIRLVQCRVLEAMSILPYFKFPPFRDFYRCLACQSFDRSAVYDVIFGSLATLVAAYITYWMQISYRNIWRRCLPSLLMRLLWAGC
jgi:hypothetical protein